MLTFDEPSHVYAWNAKTVPSVTTILRDVLGDRFASINADILAHARQRGKAWHKARELDDAGQLDEGSVAPEIAGMLDAWRSFRRYWPHKVIASELPLYHKTLGYAGTPDLVLEAADWCGVVDGKTGLPGPRAALQTVAYAELVREHFNATKLPRRFAIQVCADGKFRVTEYKVTSDWRDFISCLNVYRLRQKNT